ncbi:MAG TPA: hypothetical protein VKB67_00085 [Rhizomicrobium sp.]|nr:hypothetical protein [Rhizomicrobium sp.]
MQSAAHPPLAWPSWVFGLDFNSRYGLITARPKGRPDQRREPEDDRPAKEGIQGGDSHG